MTQPTISKQASRYCNAVKKHCPSAFQKRLISALKNDIADYIEQHPDASFADIESRFGKPKQFALEYIAAMDDETRMKAMKIAKHIKIAVIVAIVACLIVAGCAIWVAKENARIAVYSYEIVVTDE